MEAGASRIRYDVALRDIKRVPTGTELSIIVYTDAACTESYVSETVAIDDVDVELVKPIAPKGAPKGVSYARLSWEFPVSFGMVPVYLKLTAPGAVLRTSQRDRSLPVRVEPAARGHLLHRRDARRHGHQRRRAVLDCVPPSGGISAGPAPAGALAGDPAAQIFCDR
jgi:hypothetical protein